jgi:hypothetical protein
VWILAHAQCRTDRSTEEPAAAHKCLKRFWHNRGHLALGEASSEHLTTEGVAMARVNQRLWKIPDRTKRKA